MAKLQHTFLQGKMNKDLDERLVPNGQYRDASNVQVSTSEGSDVGSVENILGNALKNAEASGEWADNFGLTNAKCIGATKDSQNEKIYWLLTSDEADAIVEFDQATGLVAPIVVDMTAATPVLNFSTSYLITGINVLSGLLMWTDNLNEPRLIDIAIFKAGSSQGGNSFTVTTQVNGSDFIASDITVIKLKPETAPVITAAASVRGGNGTGVTPVITTKNFTENIGGGVYAPLLPGANTTIVCSAIPNWNANDVVVLRASQTNAENYKEYFEVRATVRFNVTTTTVSLSILYVTLSLTNIDYTWDCLLEEKEPMFNLSMPRFAYRWKYTNNEYSAYSPFTEAVFVPGPYSYDPANAYNEGMVNNLRVLTVGGFQAAPKGVVSVDVLYKDSASTAIYRVDTIPYNQASFSITSELIYSILPSDQLIRPYDNVPTKAQAQELIGNRIVYGNYVQNYDIGEAVDIGVSALTTNIATLLTPEQTIKSQRAYQVGLVYQDAFGRETPVFTNDEATIIIPKENAPKSTVIRASADQTPPSWATHYKFYIKDISNEYYNLILDRYYDSDDGNIWLSFPSAERNKVQIDDFLILKKQHNTDVAVTDQAKYKVIDISNEAPDSVKRFRKFYTNSVVTKGAVVTNEFVPISSGLSSFNFDGPVFADNSLFFNSFSEPNTIYVRFRRFGNSTPKLSQYYELDRAGFDGATTTAYSMTLTEPVSVADNWLNGLASSGQYTIEVYIEEEIKAPAFEGKFFAKINRDSIFEDNIIYNFTDNPGDFEVNKLSPDISANIPNAPITPSTSIPSPNLPLEWYGWAENAAAQPSPTSAQDFQVPTTGLFEVGFGMAPYWATGTGPGGAGQGLSTVGLNFTNTLAAGTVIQFKNQSSEWGNLYEIATYASNTYANRGVGNTEPSITFSLTLTTPFSDAGTTFTQMRTMKRRRVQSIVFDQFTKVLGSPNGAIFETEPAEAIDLNLYYEATNSLPIGSMSSAVDIPYFNAYSFGNGVESNRVRDDFNATVIGKGTKVSTVLEDDYQQERRGAGLIYSGIFNSTSGVNELNQFIAGLKITKDLNPSYGTIQKLHARDTDLIVLMEDKIFRVLANKDALFNADGDSNLTSNNNVLGQTVPFSGEYGISKNPESFASFGFRTYFSDKARGTILRLSRDGLTDIGDKDMSFYFQDKLRASTGAVIGSYDTDASSYNVAIGTSNTSFKESVDGWNTTLSYVPEAGVSLNNEYYTFKNGELYEHSNQTRSNFYGTQFDSTVTPIFNDAPTSIKNFKTLSYEGDEGWTADVTTNMQDGEVTSWKKKESLYFNFIKGKATTLANIDTEEFSVQGLGNVLSFNGTTDVVTLNGEVNISLQIGDEIYSTGGVIAPAELRLIGTVSAINRVTSEIEFAGTPPNPAPVAGNFMLFAKNSEVNTSGLLGYQATVKMTTTSSAKKELFAVNSEVFISSE